jgi:uncharacterized protein involved in exopolysaccharide biosynthesis
MELKTYLRILLKRWWIVVTAFLVTFTAVSIFTFTQTPLYRATATFVVIPHGNYADSYSRVNGVATLSQYPEIASTYSEVAMSQLVKQEAAQDLSLLPDQVKSLSVRSKQRAGTNVVEITIEGNDPLLVKNFSDKVGDKTLDYVANLYELFDMKPLDQAMIPSAPVKPNKGLNLAGGAIFGFVLGAGLVFLFEYLQSPSDSQAESLTARRKQDEFFESETRPAVDVREQ